MEKMKISGKVKVLIFITVFAMVLVSIPFVLYLEVLPYAVSNKDVQNYVVKTVKDITGADLQIENPELITILSPSLSFKTDKILLTRQQEKLLEIDKLHINLSFADILRHRIELKKVGMDYVFVDVNKLMAIVPQQEKKEQKKSDWTVGWFNSLFYIKKLQILYKAEPDMFVKVDGNKLIISDKREPKYVLFHFDVNISKNKEHLFFALDDRKSVYIKDRRLNIDNCVFDINNSRIYINGTSDEKNKLNINVASRNFDLKNGVSLLESNLVVPNGKEMLSFFKDIKGKLDFQINLSKDGLNGDVFVKQSSLKVIPVNDLPVTVTKGKIHLTPKTIYLSDFIGYYGKNPVKNKVTMTGSIKDYTKSVDMYIEASGKATNELTKDYISKLAGCPLTLIGDAGTKVIVKSFYNKMDITVMSKLAKGQDILVAGASLSPTGWDRAVKADFHFENNILDIKSINYYIASVLDKNSKGVKPILTIDGVVDCSTLIVKRLGFEIPNPLPSEFLNVLIGQKLFKGGKIAGNLQMINNTGKTPYLDGTLSMDKVRIPSQRLSVREAKFTTSKDNIHINAFGRFKRSEYKFSGDIKNELIFPVVVKNIHLTVDNIDVEKVLLSMNKQNTEEVSQVPTKVSEEELEKAEKESDDAYTFNTGLLVVERCIFELVKGNYKDITFGNLKANLTLDKNGIFEIHSNRFDFAEGISSLKVRCDLMSHKYSIRLGVKDINSDLIATTLLALKKEITGKAMGLIELNTDDSFKLNGRIQFDIRNGTIQKVGLVEYALKFAALFRNPLAMISPSTVVDLVNVPEGDFERIHGDLQIKNNVVERIMIKSSASQLSSFIIGRFDLETRDATLRIYTKFSNNNKGFAGFLRNISLNSLANRVSFNNDAEANYYAAEIAQLPDIDAEEKDCQIFLTKVDGDVEHFNFLSSLKKIK